MTVFAEPKSISHDEVRPAPPADHASSAVRTPADPDHEAVVAALRRRTPWWKPVLGLSLAAAITAVLIAIGAFPKAARRAEVAATAERLRDASRHVQLAAIRTAPASRELTLPASTRPDVEADLFAQVTGFLRERRVDIGDPVKQGDVLATIDIPLVDQQREQAKAALAESEAAEVESLRSLALAKSTLDRWLSVDVKGAVSRQEIDEKQSAFEVSRASADAAKATVASRRADLNRLEKQQEFGVVTAPFDGTITARRFDVGDLVVPPSGGGGGSSGGGSGGGSAGSSREPLFTIARLDVMRVLVDVPQTYAYSITVGQPATILVRELKDRVFTGTVTRTAGTLDARTRSLRTEITVPNADGALLGGTYVQVRLDMPDATPAVIVPGAAVIVRADGAKVAVVDDNDAIAYVPVTLGRDLGTEVEIIDGLDGTERVVTNLGDEIPKGTAVVPVAPARAK